MAFDSSGNLYATEGFAAGTIVKFSNTGALIGTFASLPGHPESLTFNAAGDVFVGQPDASTPMFTELSATGSVINTFSAVRQDRGTDWLDLGPDQCNMAYTSEGTELLSFNVCTNAQGPTVTITPPASPTYAHRLITTGPFAGDTLLASSSQAELINTATGAVLKTYLTGSSLLFAINLDRDGTSFWTGEYFSGDVYKVDIATGATLLHFKVQDFGFSPGPFGGIAILGEITAATSSTTAQGVPQFGTGASSLLIAAVAFAGMALFLRSGKSMKLLGR